MNIGFDFDKVFINNPPFLPENLVEFLYKGGSHFRKGKGENEFHYRAPNVLEKKLRVLSHHPILRQPIQENIKAISSLNRKRGVRLFLISSRFGFLKNRNEALIKKYKLEKYFEKIYFNYSDEQPHLFKLKMIEKLKIDVYVEDDLDLVLFLADKRPQLKIFWLTQKNSGLRLPKNVISIPNLTAFNKYL